LAYPVSLFAILFALSRVGETWWVTTLALYLPRIVLALPLPFLTFFVWKGVPRLLWTQGVALVALLLLLGAVAPRASGAAPGGPQLRVLSFNVNSGYAGHAAIAAGIAKYAPDLVMLQEAAEGRKRLAELLKLRYPHVEAQGEFVLASRFPIVQRTRPEMIPYHGLQRSPRFTQYRVASPLGELALYNVHPISPRGVLGIWRARSALHALRSGELFSEDPETDVQLNAGMRGLQLQIIAGLASKEPGPTLIAGDLNSPGLSRALRENMAPFEDGFSAAGWGLGYTFPARHPWMRLDRIFASAQLRFTKFQVGCEGLSDHLCVIADLQLR
jgi:vancomycin resistance protein VanJ